MRAPTGDNARVKSVLSFLRSLTTLQWALGVSVAFHAALLTVRFVDPESFNRVFQDTPLEVILVNAKSNERPVEAKAIAQSSLAGGGESNKKVRATSPLPPNMQARLGESTEDEERMLRALKEQQEQLLAQVRKQLAALPVPEREANEADVTFVERERKRKALVQILAEIEKRINEENARPRKRYISPATREEIYAVYYDKLRRKIEDQGTTNFPTAGGKKLYGELTMVITVNHTGRVVHTEIVQSSGKPALDSRAQAIVNSLSFEEFNKGMRRRADQIVVVSRFRFTRDQGLQTQLNAQ